MIICENCGRENEDEYKFCLGCGTALPDEQEAAQQEDGPRMIDCPHCGTEVPSDFKFCGACGGKIAGEVEAASAPVPGGPAVEPAPSASEEVMGRLLATG